MSTGIVDILELVEVDEEQGAAGLVDRNAVDFLFQLIDEATTVEKTGQHIVIGELQQTGVALAERWCRWLERFHDFRDFAVCCRFELHIQVAFRKFGNRFLQIRDRGQRTLQRPSAEETGYGKQDQQDGYRDLDVRQ